MKTAISIATALLFISDVSFASLIVYDPVMHTTTVVDQAVNFAKWAETEVHAAATDLNTLNTYEQEALQVSRLGDPKNLVASIPGVSNIQTLSEIYQQGEQDIQDWSAYTNPQSWKLSTDEILYIYGQPGFDGFTSNGIHLGAAQSLFQFQTSNYNVDQNAKQTVTRLTQQLKTETDQLAAATSAMQSATTEAEVAKYSSSINGLHSAISATSAALQMAKFSEQLQTQQNSTAQTISHIAQVQQTAAEDLQAIDQGLTGLPTDQMNHQILWNSQP